MANGMSQIQCWCGQEGLFVCFPQDCRQPLWVPEQLTRVLKDDQMCDADSPGNTDDGDRVQE